MNDVAKQALQNALDNAHDDLYRAKLQASRDPRWESAAGASIQQAIVAYQERVDGLEEALGIR